MTLIPVAQIASIGLNKDLPPQRLPLHAWTEVNNVVFRDGFVASVAGAVRGDIAQTGVTWIEVFKSLSGNINLYANNTDVFAFSDTATAEVTRASGDYTGGVYDFWQGGMFQGFGIINNGVDKPQSWNPLDLSTKLIDLSAWPANTYAKVVRGFKNFLVAIDVTKSGVRNTRMVKWSHSADPNTLPSSWDETDAAKDAGEISLHSGFDGLVDCLPMGDVNVLYTDNQTWAMQYVGGESIFAFRNLFPLNGLLALDCVKQFGSGHFAVTQEDIIVHNAQSVNSVADASVRRWFFNALSPAYYKLTRVVRRLQERELWICFSTSGAVLDTALIWNWRFNNWTIRELPSIRSISSSNSVYAISDDSWRVSDYTWAGETAQLWGNTSTYKTEEIVYMAADDAIYAAQEGTGEAIWSRVTRTGIAHVSETETDEYNFKRLIAIRPSFSAGVGVPIFITAGFQNDLNDAVTWGDAITFYTGTDTEVAPDVTGRYLAVKFEWAQDQTQLKFYGYVLDVVLLKEGL